MVVFTIWTVFCKKFLNNDLLTRHLLFTFLFFIIEHSIEPMFITVGCSVNSEEGLWQSEHSAYYSSGGGEVQMAARKY